MKTLRRQENIFYCFSPPVMIATFALEVPLAVYTIWRYKMTAMSRLVLLVLLFLATFQLAEYMVCEGALGNALAWSRIGYVAITLLPPLGLHLVYAVSGLKQRWVLVPTYAIAVGFAAFFLLVSGALIGHACLGNYVIFQVGHHSGVLFGLYYYGMLLAVLGVGLYQLRHTTHKVKRRALNGLLFGYMVFIVPTVAVNLLDPNTVRGIPSIMCGFAVLLALALVFLVLPATVQRKER